MYRLLIPRGRLELEFGGACGLKSKSVAGERMRVDSVTTSSPALLKIQPQAEFKLQHASSPHESCDVSLRHEAIT